MSIWTRRDDQTPVNMPSAFLRWLTVLPAAILAYAVLQLLFILLSLLLAVPLWLNHYMTQIIATIFCPYYFVYIGAKVAPSSRFVISIVLALVISGAYIAILAFAVTRGVAATPEDPLWYLIVSLVVGTVASVFAVVRVRADGLRPPKDEPHHWLGAVAQVAGNLFGIIYAYSYFGQAVLFIAMFWSEVSQNWLNIFNPFLDVENLIAAIFSWYFWVLIGVAAGSYYAMEFCFKKAHAYVPAAP